MEPLYYAVSGQTVETGEAFVFTGEMAGDWTFEIQKCSAGARPHGVAIDQITTSPTPEKAVMLAGCTLPLSVPASGSLAAGVEISTAASGAFRARGTSDPLCGVTLQSASSGRVLACLFVISLADLPSGVQFSNSLTSSAQAQINALVPPGTMIAFGGSSTPAGWLLCSGSLVSRTAYAALFAAIGTTYGAGDGSTTFGLPDMRQRFALGKASGGTGSTLGETGGNIDHHHGSPLTTSAPSATVQATILTGSASSPTHTHALTMPTDNPPFLAVNFLIKT